MVRRSGRRTDNRSRIMHFSVVPLQARLLICGLLFTGWFQSSFAAVDDVVREEVNEYGEYIDTSDPWVEARGSIPPVPADDAWIEVPIDALSSRLTLLLDPNSINVGEDGIIRYWLSLRSTRGSNNTQYEGLSCYTYQYKTYAYYGARRADKGKAGIKVLEKSNWLPIRQGNDFHYGLWQILCMDAIPVPIERIRYNLKHPQYMDNGYDPDIGPFQQ